MARFGMISILLVLGCAERRPAVVVGGDAAAPVDPGPPATSMAGALAAAGLDVAQLPPLDQVPDAQLPAVMDTFTRALGVGCTDCHDGDYAADTPQKRVARKMWDRLARGLVRRDGAPLYCDSCHAGQRTFLDRTDPTPDGALGHWMQANYVAPLERRDGATHDCSTCHGTPFVGGFLDDWAAPDEPPDAGTPPPPDLATPPPDDLGVVGCETLLQCLDGCAADDARCAGGCKQRAGAAAKALLGAAEACANAFCIGAGRCQSPIDDSSGCNVCFSNASAGGVTGVACVPADDPGCGSCAAEWLACETR